MERLYGNHHVIHNLPPRPSHVLLNREQELSHIYRDLASSSRHYVVPIEGRPGVGKTSLALAAAWHYVDQADMLPPADRFDAVVWIKKSSPTIDEATGQPVYQGAVQDTMDTLSGLMRENEIEIPTEGDPREKFEAMLKSLGDRVLLVYDNYLDYKTDHDDWELVPFLRDLPRGTKAIVTTRFHENLPSPIQLKAFAPEE